MNIACSAIFDKKATEEPKKILDSSPETVAAALVRAYNHSMPLHFNDRFWQALSLISLHSILQFTGFFGLLFLSGTALTWVSRWTNNTFRQFRFPRFGLYAFGLIGIPLHELSHAIFAKVFFHRIHRVKWFDPEGRGGSHGTVIHSHNKKNPYHRIGLFFIGLGPVLLAPLFLYGFYQGLVPAAVKGLSLEPSCLARHLLASLWQSGNWLSWKFYLFFYLTLCLTSQMELSREDLRVASSSILPIFLLLWVLNAGAFVLDLHWHSRLLSYFDRGLAIWGFFFLGALLIALLNLFICVVLLSLLNRLLGRSAVNPFRGE